jgi:hypothetical protein
MRVRLISFACERLEIDGEVPTEADATGTRRWTCDQISSDPELKAQWEALTPDEVEEYRLISVARREEQLAITPVTTRGCTVDVYRTQEIIQSIVSVLVYY